MKNPIFTGAWGKGSCHIQGIAVDKKNGFIYYSFTTKLIKATLDGEIVGSLDGLVGHLGCIAFNERDGRVYGSLEYKNDVIGRDILSVLGDGRRFEDGFYIARFDVDRIDRLSMPAGESDIMKCVYLPEVVRDYNGKGKGADHKYACSGIDGVTFASLPGKPDDDKKYLYVAYGVYGDIDREDNDHQVILCYDIEDWDRYALALDQSNMHKSGPEAPLHKYFVFTGNTTYGVQNLEYDSHTNAMLMAVYHGKKPKYPNFDLFMIDMSIPAKSERLSGLDEIGETLTLSGIGQKEKSAIHGWHFPYGATGLYSCGGGEWLISENEESPDGQCAYIYKYIWDGVHPFVKEE